MWKCPQCETVNKGEKCIICGESNPYFPKVNLNGGGGDKGKARAKTTMGQKETIRMGKNHLDVVLNMFRPERPEISENNAVQNFEKSLHTFEGFSQKGTVNKPAEKQALSKTAPVAVIEDKPSERMDFAECAPLEQERRGMLKKLLVGAVVILIVCCGIAFGFLELQRGRANSAMEAGNYDSAIEIFEGISFYRGSEYGIKECKYKKALALLADGNYEQAREGFEEMEDYKDAEKYLLLTDARLNAVEDVEVLYDLIDFADTKEILLSDSYIRKFLMGKWTDSTGKRIEFIKEGDGVKLICTLPFVRGERYRLSDGIQYHGSDEDGWEKGLRYEIVTENKIKVYCFKDGKTYTMYRQ